MKDLFSMEGRATRGRYFWHSLLDGFVIMALAVAVLIVTNMGRASNDPSLLGMIVATGIVAAGTVSEIAVTVRRLHDLDRSGWHWWLFLVPLYNLYLALLLVFKKGTAGANEYGGDPLATA